MDNTISATADDTDPPDHSEHRWTFLTNHAHVLLCVARDPDARLREIAERVGITERAVQKILVELERAGVVTKSRGGRRNHYAVHANGALRHPVESHRTIDALLHMVLDETPPAPNSATG